MFKFKPKRGYKRRTGHRQELTQIEVTEIAQGKPKPRSESRRCETGRGQSRGESPPREAAARKRLPGKARPAAESGQSTDAKRRRPQMAHKKGLGSSRNGRDSNAQRLGVKTFAGQAVTRRRDHRAPARHALQAGRRRRHRQGRHALRARRGHRAVHDRPPRAHRQRPARRRRPARGLARESAAAGAGLLAAGRAALGVAVLAAPEPVTSQLAGRATPSIPAVRYLARSLGARDLALGRARAAARSTIPRAGAAASQAACAVVDSVDALATVAARSELPRRRRGRHGRGRRRARPAPASTLARRLADA